MKTFRKIVLSFCLLFAVTILSACGEAKVTEIYIQEDSIALTVEHNSTWSTDDIVVKAKLSNGKEKVISDVEFSPIDTSIVGEQVLTVTYGVYECKVTITVTPTILNYELKGVEPKFKHNSTIDLSKAYVQVTYSDFTQTNIHNGFTVTDEGTDTVGEHKYHLTFGNYQKDFTYNVVKTVSSITVNGVTEDELIYGTEYDTTGITAVVTYSDDTTADLTNDKLSFILPTNELGSQKLTVSYTDSDSGTSASQEFDVEVIQVLESIAVELNYENKTAGFHVLGEEFDKTQFKVNANYSKDKNVSLNLNDVEITNIPTASSSLGTHTITFTYNGKTTTKDITIVESYANIPNEGFVVTSIAIDTASIASSTNYGNDINLSNLVVIATYNNNPEMTARLNYSQYSSDITTSFDNTPVFEESNTTTTSILSVTYKDLPAATCNITVNRVLKSLTIDEGFTTTYNYGDTFTLPTVYATYTDSETKYPVTVTANKENITTPNKESFTDGVATVNVEYTYNYSIVDTANGGKNFVSHDITINDVVESILVDEKSIPDNAIVGKDYNISTLKIKETYVSGNTKVYSYVESDNKYSISFDKSTAGYKDFTVALTSNSDVKNSVEVYVRDFYGLALSAPAFISTFNSASTVKNEYVDQLDKTEKTKGFAKTASEINYIYKVGDDNPFKFSPILQTKATNKTNNYKLGVKVYLNDSTTALTGADLDRYVSIDYKNHTLDFTEEAIKVDKIRIAAGLGFTLTADDATTDLSPIEFTLKVVDGWNVYTARDLSVVDNTNDTGKWTTIKSANVEKGLEDLTQINTNGIILHQNISIEKNDIPSIHFYSAENNEGYEGADLASVNGHMINADYYTAKAVVYERHIADGESFNIEGNFFTISAEKLPLVKKVLKSTDDKAIVISTTLFSFVDTYTDFREVEGNEILYRAMGREDTNEETCTINNLSLMGNSNKNETTSQAGLVCYKAENINFTMNNCLSQSWYIAHYFEGSSLTGNNVTHTLKYCNAFDSYNSLIYAYGARKIILEDCTMIGAGGPVMICDEVHDIWDLNDDDDLEDTINGIKEVEYKYQTNLTTTNSILQSWVVGSEGWFGAFEDKGAKVLAAGLNACLTGINKTNDNPNGLVSGAIKDSKMNLVAVYKVGSLAMAGAINGTFTDTNHTHGLDFKNSDIFQTSEQMILQSFNGAMFYPARAQSNDMSEKIKSFRGLDESITDPQTTFKNASQYLGIYVYNGMGAVVGID